jgi:4-cresol dehydrogenase (hydroxylating)
MSLNLVSPRAACAVIGIFFDKTVSEERELARVCHNEMLSELLAHGFHPYRMSSRANEEFPELFSEHDPFWKTCRKIKEALDPKGILSPGRYGL